MNPFIKNQLEKLKNQIPSFDDNTVELIIPKRGFSPLTELEVGNNYLIEVENYVINEPPNFTLSTNWNNNTKPISRNLYVKINRIMGSMVNVTSQTVENGDVWVGWLPRKSFKVKEQIL